MRSDPTPSDDPAFDGDPAWRVKRSLPDGTVVTIRPITPEDRDELRRAFESTSAQTRYLRFLAVMGDLTDEMLTYLTCVDQKNHVALVATVTTPDLKTERGVGVARFIRLDDAPDAVEAAITVVDDMQRKGIGRALGMELERAARARGVRRMRAEVLNDNLMMRSILEAAGAKRLVASDGTTSYDLELGPEPMSRSDRLRHILGGAAQTMAFTIRRLSPPAAALASAASAAAAARHHDAEGAKGKG